MSQVEEKYYTQDLGSLVISEEDKKEIEKDWSAWILKTGRAWVDRSRWFV